MTTYIEKTEATVNLINQQQKDLVKRHKEAYELFGLDDKDDIVKEGSEQFLKVFIEFFKHSIEALPKTEKLRG